MSGRAFRNGLSLPFINTRDNKNMTEIKSMCESCHQPNQGGEGIEHDKGCPESDQQED